jgi:hypothetical protein
VCLRPFLKEIEHMTSLLEEIGPVDRSWPAWQDALAQAA